MNPDGGHVIKWGTHRFRIFTGNVRARERAFGPISAWSVEGRSAEFTTMSIPDDSTLTFAFADSGDLRSQFEDGVWSDVADSFIVAPHGISSRLRCEGECRIILLQIPRSSIAAFVPDLPSDARVFSDRRVLDHAMQRFIGSVLDDEADTSAIEKYAIEQLILEMSGALLLDRLGSVRTAGSPRSVLRDRALAVIAQQSGDPDLTPSRVARDVQSSLRQLQLLFSEAGTTVAGEIRRQRARLARGVLTDSRFDVLTVDQVALRSGFANTMSLRRALRDIYQAAPSALRLNRGA